MKGRKSRLKTSVGQYAVVRNTEPVTTTKADTDSSNMSRFFTDNGVSYQDQIIEPIEDEAEGLIFDEQFYDDSSIPNQNRVSRPVNDPPAGNPSVLPHGGNTGVQQDTNPSGTLIPNFISDINPVLPDNEHNDARQYNIGHDVFPTEHHKVESIDIAVNPDHFLPLTSQTVIASPNVALDQGEFVPNPSVGEIPALPASSEKGVNAATTINTTNPHSHIPNMVGRNIEHLIDEPRPPYGANSENTYNDLRIEPELARVEQANFTNPLNYPLSEAHREQVEREDYSQQVRDNEGSANENSAKVMPDSTLPDTPESLYEARLYGNAALQSLKLYKGLRPDDVGIDVGLDNDIDDSVKAEDIVEFKPDPYPTPRTTPIYQQNLEPRQAFVANGNEQGNRLPPHNYIVNEESALIASTPLTAGGDTIDYNVIEGTFDGVEADDVIIGRQRTAPASHYESDGYAAPPDQNVKSADNAMKAWMSYMNIGGELSTGNDDKFKPTSFKSKAFKSSYRDFGTNPAVIPFEETIRNRQADRENAAMKAIEMARNSRTAAKFRRQNSELANTVSGAAKTYIGELITSNNNMIRSIGNDLQHGVKAMGKYLDDVNTTGNTNANSNESATRGKRGNAGRDRDKGIGDSTGYDTAYSADDSINDVLTNNLNNGNVQREYYVDPSTPAGANTNVHAEPVAEFIAAFNEIAVDTMRDMHTAGIPKILDPRYEQRLPEYEVITPERLEQLIAVGEQALEEHEASLALPMPDTMDEEQYALFIDTNNDIVEAINDTLDYLVEALDVVHTAYQYDSYMLPVVGDVDDDPELDADVANITTLNAQFYESLYYASLFLQRSGDRFDQFVVNMKRPAERFVGDTVPNITVGGGNGLAATASEDDEFYSDEFEVGADNQWHYRLGMDNYDGVSYGYGNDDDEVFEPDASYDVTDRLLDLAAQALPSDKALYTTTAKTLGVSKAVGTGNVYALYKTAAKNSLSLRQVLAAFNKVYSRVMSAAGGWLYATPLVSGVSKQELDALAEEGLIRYDNSGGSQRFTLTRQGYERPQWLDLSAGVKPADNMTGMGNGNVRF